MDLLTYWGVAKRRWRIIFGGLALAVLLSGLALVKISGDGVELRSPPVYRAASTIFVTQDGFPWGRSALDEFVRPRGARDPKQVIPRFSEPSRMEYLASLYARLAEGDEVEQLIKRSGVLGDRDEYVAAPLTGDAGRALPLLEITAYSESADNSVALANQAAQSLRAYVAREQRQNAISESAGIQLPVIERAQEAEVFEGVRLTTPIMVFLLVTIATILLAFLVDSVKRVRAESGGRTHVVASDEEDEGVSTVEELQPSRELAVAGNLGDVSGRSRPARQAAASSRRKRK